MRAFSQNVGALSSGSGIGSTSARPIRSHGRPLNSGRISRSLLGFVVAIKSLPTVAFAKVGSAAQDRSDDRALFGDQIVDALVGERQQARQRIGAERLGLGGALNLHEPSVARLDDVHV